MSLKEQIIPEKLPKHIAIIMDGNGRWAKAQGEPRYMGHKKGVDAVKEITETCAEIGVKYLTVYAFSTENWSRPESEVIALMQLLVTTIKNETETLMKNDIRLQAIGNMQALPGDCYEELEEAMAVTANNKRMTLVLALSYSSRWEIEHAMQQIAKEVQDNKLRPEDIDSEKIQSFLTTKDFPDPELLIRTSGEFRMSNFLLWQCAYSELYFTETYWPDFDEEELYKAILNYQNRERRFGKTSEQLLTDSDN